MSEINISFNFALSTAALKEFRQLAHEFVNVLPSRFKYLLEDCVYVDKK